MGSTKGINAEGTAYSHNSIPNNGIRPL